MVMASRAFQISFENARPTYNDAIILGFRVAIMEFGNVTVEDFELTVGILDTIIQVQNAMAQAVRDRATALGFSAISINNITLFGLTKA